MNPAWSNWETKNRKRRLWQLAGAILANPYFVVIVTGQIYQGFLKGVCVPTLNCYGCPLALFSCPIGTLQHLVIMRIFPFYLLGYLGVIGIIAGRMVSCGWLCPFGFLQDLLYKIKTRKIKIPRRLGYLRYASLIFLALLAPYLTGEPWFTKLCPQGTLEAGLPWVGIDANIRSRVSWFFSLKVFILVAFLVLMVLSKRPFCQTFCPLGAIYSLFNKLSFIRLAVDTSKCNKCNRCEKVCPTGIRIYVDANSSDCIRCLECTSCAVVRVRNILKAGD